MRPITLTLLLLVAFGPFAACRRGDIAQSQSSVVSVDPYDVYSAFLVDESQGHPDDDLRAESPRTAILAEIPAVPPSAIFDLQRYLQEQFPQIETGTIASVLRCSKDSHRLEHKFNLPFPYKIADDKKAKYPLGYLQFSCVGINPAGTQAVFSVERTRCHCGVGKWILMRRAKNAGWDIEKEVIEWIE
jgi:hypothetical protein